MTAPQFRIVFDAPAAPNCIDILPRGVTLAQAYEFAAAHAMGGARNIDVQRWDGASRDQWGEEWVTL